MDGVQKHKWKLLALGGACTATAALVFLAHRRSKRDANSARKASPKQAGTSSRQTASKAASAARKEQITRKSVADWVANLGKKENDELPTLLEWTDKLLDEKPKDSETLERCLNLVQHFVLSNKMVSEASAVALKAKHFAPQTAVEILVNLFKDKKSRGHIADSAVVDHVLATMKNGMKGTSSRPVYHRACRLLYFLSPTPSNRQKIVKAGGLDVLVQMMEKFSDDPGVLLECCHALRGLAAEPTLDAARAFNAVITCLSEKHRENGDLQMIALADIHALPLPPGTEMQVAELAVAAAKQHPCQDGVIEFVAKVLHRLCKVEASEVKTWLRSEECSDWLEGFWESPRKVKRQNKEVDFWVAELCQLCGS
eukprot:gnl/MRDRNA2_/MRDRNA2_36482_c0_seq1.p1 gnl/MRDRNA2_/MRDRNA2_36482_c0~~gnl/MRDRNA2_/MRDRNA2_36482_c0_seq1.p1  ORF type:complete len:397 (-),score=84.05 gnl/MRDRNA2_/MRDRNA2_36482_c0_seq1:84-1190(-)